MKKSKFSDRQIMQALKRLEVGLNAAFSRGEEDGVASRSWVFHRTS